MYKVNLDIFEGPFDLLLYLIHKDEVDIQDIPIAQITREYLEFINLMEDLDFNVAGEFLVMAAQLMLIKSRMLLPPDTAAGEGEPGEEDPRAELVRQLLEYRQFKEAAEQLKSMEGHQRDVFFRLGPSDSGNRRDAKAEFDDSPLDLDLFDLLKAFQRILDELPENAVRELEREEVPVVQKINEILDLLEASESISFFEAFRGAKTKVELVATFLAMLELAKMRTIVIRQAQLFGEIRLYRNKTEEKNIDPAGEDAPAAEPTGDL